MATFNNDAGTTSDDFQIGSDLPVGFRTNAGVAEYQDNAGTWKALDSYVPLPQPVNDRRISIYNGTTGLIQNSLVDIDALGNVNLPEGQNILIAGTAISTLGVRRNLVVNGDGTVQQRVSDRTLVNNTWLIGPDRWWGNVNGTTLTAGTYGNTGTAPCGISGFALQMKSVTTTGATTVAFRTRLEAIDAGRVKNQYCSFSCNTYHDSGQMPTVTIYIRRANAVNDFSTTTNISNSIAFSVSNTTDARIKYENFNVGDSSLGLEIEVRYSFASALTADNIYCTACQLERSPQVTDFEYHLAGDGLQRCQRYLQYFKGIDDGGTGASRLGMGWVHTGNSRAEFLLPFTQMARVAPTGITASAANTFLVHHRSTTYTPTAISFVAGTRRCVHVRVTVPSVSTGNSVMLRCNSVNAYLECTGVEL